MRPAGLIIAAAFIALPGISTGSNTIEHTDSVVTVSNSSVADMLLDADYGDAGDVILQVYLRDIPLTDALFARVSDSRLYLPLGELAGLLEFPIVVDAAGGTAAGWYLSPDRTINIDVSAKRLLNNDKLSSIPAHAILADDFDIYIDAQSLEQWLPLAFDFSLAAQRLTIRSTVPFPAELARARAQRKVSSDTVFQAAKPYDIPGYRVLDWPTLALNIGSSLARTQSTPTLDYNFRALGDLAFMNGTLSGTGTDTELRTLRLTLGRSNPSGMLGPLRAADFQFGDTSQFLPGLIGSSISGRGLRFGNSKLSAQRDLDTIDLQGELIADYEVELYVNERLRGVVRDTDDGLYRFEDVQLRSGQNEIRLEFYGPQGQRKTEVDRTYVGADQTRNGQLSYEVSLLQPQRLVFEDLLAENSDIKHNPTTLSGAVDLSYGLGRRATIGMTLASLAPQEATSTEASEPDTPVSDNLTYLNTRLTMAALGSLFSYDLTADDSSNLAGALKWRSRRGDYELAASQIIYGADFRRFNDRNQLDPDQLSKRNTSASIARVYRNGLGGAYSWSADMKHNTSQGDQKTVSGSLRVDYRRNYIGSTWAHSYQRNLDLEKGNSSGALGFNLRLGEGAKWSYRGDLAYADTGDAIRSASLGASRSFGNHSGISVQATRDISAEQNFYSASWSRQFSNFQFTSGIAGSSTEDISLRFGVSLAVQRYPGRLLPSFDGRSNTAARVAAHVFADDNNNGKRDRDEAGLKGVRLTRNGLITNAITDENGYALLGGLPSSVSTDVDIIGGDIDDPTLRSTPLSTGILPRPGRLPIMQIPLQRTVDIEGKVTVAENQPAPNVRMVLRPEDGSEPLIVQTEFDGVYYLAGVPLGRYELEPDREQLATANLHAEPTTRTIELADANEEIKTFNFVLQRTSAAQVTFATKTLTTDDHGEGQSGNSSLPAREEPLLAAAFTNLVQFKQKATTPSTALPQRTGKRYDTPITPTTASEDSRHSDTSTHSHKNNSNDDHDLDGVPDSSDKCHGTRQTESVNRYGCVHVGAELHKVSFDAGSSVITTDSAFALNAVAREMIANPHLDVVIYTHTDNHGSAQRNMSLSISRARSIIRYLVYQGNIAHSRLSGVAMGESAPLTSNLSARGRAINRRVVAGIKE